MATFRFDTTRSIICEQGGLARLGELCALHGIRRPLVVTDPGVVAAGLYDKLNTALVDSGLAFQAFTEVMADPPEPVILAALEQAKQFKAAVGDRQYRRGCHGSRY
jgi:alcohol dehydrogenase